MMSIFICPVCGAGLFDCGKSFVCAGGHSFDTAKSGYVNLLLSNRPGAVHGDDRHMLVSRRDFLNNEYYAPLLRALCQTAERFFSSNPLVLDAGCGECYYTAGVYNYLVERNFAPEVYGIDVSKDALIMGSKRSKGLRLAAASIFSLPFAPGLFDAVFSVFAPFCAEEFSRVLKPGGVLIRVLPGRRHLWELKTAVYDKPYENNDDIPCPPGFSPADTGLLRFETELSSNSDIRSLFDMTPYAYRTSPADAAKLACLTELKTTVEFRILSYKKEGVFDNGAAKTD